MGNITEARRRADASNDRIDRATNAVLEQLGLANFFIAASPRVLHAQREDWAGIQELWEIPGRAKRVV